ncbi:transporter [Erythrobacter sp.]|uniref:transporter n=1 Tax=Erythrobacter sp. TaxID=1042 RepID=UPI001425FE62|nr:transporter [Erythrobacter sp.]QIQ85690.1 MAG: transporter [Erythrobacter sp.]
MERQFQYTAAGVVLAAALACGAVPASAQDAGPDDPAATRENLEEQLKELRAREREYRDRLEALEARLALIERGQEVPDASLAPAEAANLRGAYIAPRPLAIPDDPSLAFFRKQDLEASFVLPSQEEPPTGGGGDEEEERRSPAPTEAVAEISGEQQGRFGDRLGFDLGLSYSHFDTARISLNGFLALDAIFLGTISIDQVKSDIFTFDPTIRYGINDRLFVDANLPFLYRTSNFRSGGAGGSASALVERTIHDEGLGDLSIGASYRAIAETAKLPDVVVSARVKFPTGRDPFGIEFVEVTGSEGNLQVPENLATGTGVYGASLGFAVLKTLDPLVVFGNATYFHNFSRDFDDIDEAEGDIPGRVDIGDAFQFGAGLAFALNDKSSISMSYSQRIVERTRLTPEGQDSRIVVGSQANVGLVNLGATFSLGPRLALVTNVGIGLTDDSPDMSVGIRLPFRF